MQPSSTVEAIVAHPQSNLYAVRGEAQKVVWGWTHVELRRSRPQKRAPRSSPIGPVLFLRSLEVGSGQLAVEHGPSPVKILCRLASTGGGDDARHRPDPFPFPSALVDSADEPMPLPAVVLAASFFAVLGSLKLGLAELSRIMSSLDSKVSTGLLLSQQ